MSGLRNPSGRSNHASLAQIRAVCQPPEITGRGKAEHWTGDLYMRSASLPLTKLFIASGWSANAVTWLMIGVGIAAGAALLLPGFIGALLAAVLIQLQMLIDCCDGQVARWRGTSSPKGIFLDAFAHHTAEAALCIGFGISVAGGLGEPSWWSYLGALLAVGVVINRAMNEMVGRARLRAGLPLGSEASHVYEPNRSLVARAKSWARLIPIHRLLHSIELSLVIVIAALFDVVVGSSVPSQIVLVVLVCAVPLVIAGHLAAILSSRRLQ